jgi:predicted membrane protein
MKQNAAKYFIGLIIVVVGIGIILKAAGIEFTLFFEGWWTLPIIIVAIVSMSSGGIGPGNFALLLIGSWLLANQRNWIPQWFNGAYVIGAAVIGFGLLFIFNPRKEEQTPQEQSDRPRQSHQRETPRQRSTTRAQRDTDNLPSYTAIFSGQDIRNSTENLDGSTLFALFGGLSVDFRDARIDHDIIIDASAVFGGIDLMFPSNVRVVTKATPLFGGVDNKSRPPRSLEAPTVTVRCLAAFGGIDIT